MVRLTGLEPVTFAMSMQRSSQLSYKRKFYEWLGTIVLSRRTWFDEPSKSEGTLTINFSSPYLYGETKGTRTPNLFRDRDAL